MPKNDVFVGKVFFRSSESKLNDPALRSNYINNFACFQDEVIALQDKVIIRASDLMTWIVEEKDWDWGFVTPSCKVDIESNPLSKAFMSEKYGKEDKLSEYSEPSKFFFQNYELNV